MNRCKVCEKELMDSESFCMSCGAAVDSKKRNVSTLAPWWKSRKHKKMFVWCGVAGLCILLLLALLFLKEKDPLDFIELDVLGMSKEEVLSVDKRRPMKEEQSDEGEIFLRYKSKKDDGGWKVGSAYKISRSTKVQSYTVTYSQEDSSENGDWKKIGALEKKLTERFGDPTRSMYGGMAEWAYKGMEVSLIYWGDGVISVGCSKS